MAFRYVPEEVTAKLVTYDLAMEATRRAFLAVLETDAVSFPVVLGHGSDQLNRFSVKSGASAQFAGLKVGSYWPGNADNGRPRHNSSIVFFDQEIGRIDTLIEAGAANGYRTAAGNALAVSYLARKDAADLTIFGAGHQAFHECEAVARVRSLKRISIVNRDRAKAERMATQLAALVPEVRVAQAEDACRNADIIVTATGARQPLFEAGWVRPGTHISCMGADAPGKQEAPPELLLKAELFCDFLAQSMVIGEFQHVAGEIRRAAVTPTQFGIVLAGQHPGRRSAEAITVFDSSGLALQDLFLGQLLLEASISQA